MTGVCAVNECPKSATCRGWCNVHYQRWYRFGDPMKILPRSGNTSYRGDPLARFHASYVEDPDGCLIWDQGIDAHGYGRFYADAVVHGTPGTTKAHGWIFEVVHGFAPPVVMHHCDKPPCVRISCLMPGTLTENHNDMMRKGRGGHGTTGGARGIDHHMATLSDDEVREIRDEYALGILTQQMLAEAYGVARSAISLIVNGKRRSIPAAEAVT